MNSIQIAEAVARVDVGADTGDIFQHFDNLPLMSVSDLNFVNQQQSVLVTSNNSQHM